jgi:hypothetical protein
LRNPFSEVRADLSCNNTNNILSCNSIFLKRNFIFATKYSKKEMFRPQTYYLILCLVITGVLPFIFPLWIDTTGKTFFFMMDIVYVSLFGLSTTLSLLSILSHKKRQQQFVMGRLNMILNLILLGLFVYRTLNLSGETATVSEKGIGMFLPIFSIVFLVLANKAIKKDEDLVKSVDRLR